MSTTSNEVTERRSRITGAVQPVDGKCPKCGKQMERRAAQFFWRGTYFNGLVCCNSLWDDPTDSFEEYVFSGKAPARE